MKIRAAEGTKTIDFGTLWDVLKSNDPYLLEKEKWMFEGDCKYLDAKSERNV